MGNVEKYGLLALFVLCALIVGVGVFGGDGTAGPAWRPPQSEAPPAADGAQTAGWQSEPAAAAADARRRGDRLEPVPSPGRDRSLPADAELWTAAPKVLERSGPPPAGRASSQEKAVKKAARRAARRKIRVRDGDSFEKIAIRELGSRKFVAALMAANPGIAPTRLKPGQMLNRPEAGPTAGRLHVVVAGDTLQRIARRFYGSTRYDAFLARANGMKRDDVLRVDRVLRIPPRPKSRSKTRSKSKHE